MNPLTDLELTERRKKIQSVNSSFGLTESIGELLIDIAGQTSGQSAGLTAIKEVLSAPGAGIGSFSTGIGAVKTSLDGMTAVATDARDQLRTIATALKDPDAGIGSLSTGIGGVKASLDGMTAVAADARDQLRTIATELGETKELIRVVCGHLDNLALRGTEQHPSHIHLDGAPHRMIVELQPATFEGLAQLLQKCCTTMAQSVEEQSQQSTRLFATISHNEQRLAALEQRTAEHETRIHALGDASGVAPRPPRRT